jgi:oxygen-independent coproporphyrinogen III oxidase
MTGNGANALGIYISFPFCRSKCTYCNFASGVYPAADHVPYVARLIDDLDGAKAWAAAMAAELPRRVDTVYLGGGTPSLLDPNLLERLFNSIHTEFDLDAGAEVTMECAPGQLADATLAALVAAGVNRVSLGVQSFVDSETRASGRLHDRAAVEADLRRLRAAGIANLNLDLIAGLAGQTLASWEESLAALVDSGVPHASVYMLEVDEDSRLGREVLKRGARYRADLVPSDDTIARMYEFAIERLEQAGLGQYEISNFARPGFESRHNLRYWQRRPYLGVGLDASSMLRASVESLESGLVPGHDLPGSPATGLRRRGGLSRAANNANSMGALAPPQVLRSTTTDDLKAYLVGPTAPETTWHPPARQHEEAWFLGLRMNEGVSVGALRHEFGPELVEPAMETVERLVDDGLLVAVGARVRLTARGRLLSNDVFQEFLEPAAATTACDG